MILKERGCSLPIIRIRGDHLLLALDVIQFIDRSKRRAKDPSPYQCDPSETRLLERGFSHTKVLKVLDRCKCTTNDLYTHYSHPALRPANEFRILQEFLRDNAQETAQTIWNFSGHERIHGIGVDESITCLFSTFASGEITEADLKNPESANA